VLLNVPIHNLMSIVDIYQSVHKSYDDYWHVTYILAPELLLENSKRYRPG
jgi:hypothetical protein